ncbi:MAG: crossover junction endodeoxyribonuclease RuvC [Victivallaceae bacterium]|mgnify:CR=1 FL=1|nr:crossover junction endodeoxyribonuclease RuvC [Victivallaceae bacterium]MDD3702865.1 crossover junction endodeoxyribonuclease RuvC [Victivallaceae bacterium]
MIILGIDPAIRCSGYAVIKATAVHEMSVIDCGFIKNDRSMPHTECLRRIAGGIRDLITTYNPDAISIEDPFLGKNPSTVIILGMARGAILAVCGELGVPVYPYTPTTAKRAAVGNGKAEKGQVALIMSAMFHLEAEQIPLDATDALALALCHAQNAVRPALQMLMPKTL